MPDKENPLCARCNILCETPCTAFYELAKVYQDLRAEIKTDITRRLRGLLNIIDYETADDLQELGEKIIKAMPELYVIPDYDVRIGYVRSYEAKRDKGKIVFADCRKVRGTYTAYLPFDFIVTYYEPNTYHMTENQKKILMLHELRHIGMGEKGLKVENHDVEDFKDILQRFGIEWNRFNQDCPDILAGGDDGQCTKGHTMEAKSKAGSNGGTPAKSRGSKDKNRENERGGCASSNVL